MKNNRYTICWTQICPFGRVENGMIKPNREDYPYRLCVLDKENGIVIDVKSKCRYDYIQTSSIYFMKEESKKIELGKRYAIKELQSSMFLTNDDDINQAREIMCLLKNGIGFADGNMISNEQYLESIKEDNKENNKVKKKEKRVYYEYKGNNK